MLLSGHFGRVPAVTLTLGKEKVGLLQHLGAGGRLSDLRLERLLLPPCPVRWTSAATTVWGDMVTMGSDPGGWGFCRNTRYAAEPAEMSTEVGEIENRQWRRETKDQAFFSLCYTWSLQYLGLVQYELSHHSFSTYSVRNINNFLILKFYLLFLVGSIV